MSLKCKDCENAMITEVYCKHYGWIDATIDCECTEHISKEEAIRAKAIEEYKSTLKEDVLARAKSYAEYSDKINAEVFNYATNTFIQALDYFANQLKETKQGYKYE